jgi:hypothetical protein
MENAGRLKNQNQKDTISYEKTIILGVAATTYNLLGPAGLLTSLGFSVAYKLLEVQNSFINEKMIKLIN